ncbi:hypothetical protein POM88_044032 [Heracleum sosnowskyi]|uniref:Calmodulin binding protein-like N-terminal domain-containing protein n=1 Tax=Heracleum sosnowskyi TaxID=360622 RepID=A0AAD8H3I9_9APIA|nr:hypothetical protein POM88_044032 [Heracleum sosnowskyi]
MTSSFLFDEEMQPADPRSWQMQFLNTVSQPISGESLFEADGDTKIKLALIDASTGEIVSNEPISSAKVEIVVFDADIDDDVGDNWTYEKFSSNLVGLHGDITFTDNSSWRRSRKFRLGARVLNNCYEIRVREGRTCPFVRIYLENIMDLS